MFLNNVSGRFVAVAVCYLGSGSRYARLASPFLSYCDMILRSGVEPVFLRHPAKSRFAQLPFSCLC